MLLMHCLFGHRNSCVRRACHPPTTHCRFRPSVYTNTVNTLKSFHDTLIWRPQDGGSIPWKEYKPS